MRKNDELEERSRKMALDAGLDPNSRIDIPGSPRGMPIWCTFRDAAQKEYEKEKLLSVRDQLPEYTNANLTIFGTHDENTIMQMKNCMSVGNVVGGVLCADGHLGYAQPVGGTIAYKNQISISGVGFDIGCGNMAIKLDVKYSDVKEQTSVIGHDISRIISFGIGRANSEKVEHSLFDNSRLWHDAGVEDLRVKAESQLGTVGSGNHYVDVLYDKDGYVWIGVHFGSRGLGHTSAARYLKLAGGKDGIDQLPTILPDNSELGQKYIAAMTLAGEYSYAGREWVIERVRKIIGGTEIDRVHNHHNYAWQENHFGENLWVVRKGATPCFPGQRSFIGGSMGDDCVIVEGIDSEEAKKSYYSTIHGAGRLFSRKLAKKTFTRAQMELWLMKRDVFLLGADLDESPMAYRRLPEVLAHHASSLKVQHILHPFIVIMAGAEVEDPFRD